VEKNLKLASIQKQEHAQECVPHNYEKEICLSKVKSVHEDGYEDVFNMEVDKYHNFAVNNGYIVHNCMDTLRYITMEELPPKRKTNGVQMFKNF
jgi:hypothetical protein